jgi:Icc protein
MKFLHLTDSHILKSYEHDKLASLFNQVANPLEKVRRIVEGVSEEVDFIMITGDLIHDGGSEDYLLLKQLMDESKIPVYVALGNHDVKANFHEAFFGEKKEQAYYYELLVNNYRLIVLDSAVKDLHEGSVSEEQLNWLEEILKESYGEGTLLFLHHPIVWEDEQLSMQNNERLIHILKNSDCLGIFTGHTHMNGLFYIDEIPQFTSEGISFGLEKHDGTKISATNQSAYNEYHVQNKKISMKRHHITPELHRISTYEYEEVFPKVHTTKGGK